MTPEDKELLLSDLYGRLRYGLMGIHRGSNHILMAMDATGAYQVDGYDAWFSLDEVMFKPYLRPMSDMTDEEIDIMWEVQENNPQAEGSSKITDLLNKWGLDHHHLIEKGLAAAAPDGMYDKGSDISVPSTVEEAVSTLGRILSDEDREYLLENGAISMHDSLGRWIRNEWGLWTGSKLKDELIDKGLVHPDDMSNYILEEFIKYWNSK